MVVSIVGLVGKIKYGSGKNPQSIFLALDKNKNDLCNLIE